MKTKYVIDLNGICGGTFFFKGKIKFWTDIAFANPLYLSINNNLLTNIDWNVMVAHFIQEGRWKQRSWLEFCQEQRQNESFRSLIPFSGQEDSYPWLEDFK